MAKPTEPSGDKVARTLSRLQARKLDRVAAVYAVGGWLLVQAASIVLPTFGAPEWTLRAFIALALIGFPLTLAIAWIVAPHPGSFAGAAPVPSKFTDATLLAALGIVAALIIAQAGYELLRPHDRIARASVRSGAPADSVPPEGSLAVLPFVNMSGDPAKEYFSDGISEELLNDLSNDPHLRVAARTSSFAFKGKNEDIETIARALRVRAVVEGSVREAGNHVRITAQLINASDGYHLWSGTYDRDLSDILSVQDDLARAIAAVLTSKLEDKTITVVSNQPRKIDPAVYRLYLEGLKAYDGANAWEKAYGLFKEVTRRQPDFADGYASLADTAWGFTLLDAAHSNDYAAEARSAAQTALELDPRSVRARGVLLDLALDAWNWANAGTYASYLRKTNPNNADAAAFLSHYFEHMGFQDDAIAERRRSLSMDPLSDANTVRLSDLLLYADRNDEAIGVVHAVLAHNPDHAWALHNLCSAYAFSRRIREAQAVEEHLRRLKSAENYAEDCAFNISVNSPDLSVARKIASKWAAEFPDRFLFAADMAENYVDMGDFDKASEWYERAYERRESGFFRSTYWVDGAKFRMTPQWKSLTQREAFKEWQAEHHRVAAELARGTPVN